MSEHPPYINGIPHVHECGACGRYYMHIHEDPAAEHPVVCPNLNCANSANRPLAIHSTSQPVTRRLVSELLISKVLPVYPL